MCKHGEMTQTMQLLAYMNKHKYTNDYTYSMLLSECSKTKRFEAADAIYQTSVENNVPLSLEVYNVLMKLYCQSKRLDKALEIYHHVLERNLQPTPVTYNILITGCIYAREFGKVDMLLANMKNENIHLTQQLATTLINLNCRSGKLQKSL